MVEHLTTNCKDQEPFRMTKYLVKNCKGQASGHFIKNCEGRRTEHLYLQLHSPDLELTDHLHQDWNQGHPKAMEAASQHGIPDPSPPMPPKEATDDERKEARMKEKSNGDLVGTKEGRLCSPINLDSSGHLHSPSLRLI